MRVYDAIVVGSGAAGGWAAKELTERGLDVLLLEAGPIHPRDIRQGLRKVGKLEPSRQSRQALSSGFNDSTSAYFVDDEANPYSFPIERSFAWIRGRQLGGRMHVWGRCCLRFSSRELGAWPIAEGDLDPYYEKVERFLGMTGSEARNPGVPDGIYARTTAIPPPLLHVKARLEARWPDRQLISGRLALGEHELTLGAALATGKLTLRTNAVVSHVVLDKDSALAKGVAFVDRLTHRAEECRARIVFLCASAFETVRILLNSREDARFAEGIGASSGALGRYLLDHTSGVRLSGIAKGRVEGERYPYNPLTHVPNFCRREDGFAVGYGTHLTTLSANGLFLDSGTEHARHLAFLARHSASLVYGWCFGEVTPRRENHCRLLPDVRDAWGIPTLHIDMTYSDEEKAAGEHQRAFLQELAEASDLDAIRVTPTFDPPGASVHELGGARMGRHAGDSVVDPSHRCWDVPNVVVADGACFATAGWQNPALTIMAVAARASQHAADWLAAR